MSMRAKADARELEGFLECSVVSKLLGCAYDGVVHPFREQY